MKIKFSKPKTIKIELHQKYLQFIKLFKFYKQTDRRISANVDGVNDVTKCCISLINKLIKFNSF